MLTFSDYQINQLYHPTGKYKADSQNIIYSLDNLNKTKFVPILLKEWFYLLKKDGYMIIDYKPNKICDNQKLEDNMMWLWKDKYKKVFHGLSNSKDIKKWKLKELSNLKSGYFRFICQKTVSTENLNDTINKWTFGIITNGKRIDWVKRIINSIKLQAIPNYEIIICGTYPCEGEADIKYIPFNLRDDRGWITKKKNLIVKEAQFENICMLHDRMVLDASWFQGMRKWGNCFENLGCRQLFKGERVNDWVASHYFINSKNGEKFSFESYVDYRDWYESIWFMGQLNIFKKSIITKNNLWWDESLFYGEREDYHFSKKLNDNGFIHRFNEFSKVYTLTNKYVNPTWIKYDLDSLDPRMQLNNLNSFLKFLTYLILKILNFLGISLSFNTLENWRGKIYTLILMIGRRKVASR